MDNQGAMKEIPISAYVQNRVLGYSQVDKLFAW